MKNKVDLSSYNNDLFRSSLPSLPFRLLWYWVSILVFRNPLFTGYGFKRWLLRSFGAKLGKGVVIKPSVNIKYPWNLHVGDHSWIGENVWIDNLAVVYIGRNACLSQGAMLLTGNHDYSKASFDLMVNEIHLEDGAWVGAKSVVCPGVCCKTHSVLAVGSVANKDLEPYTIYQGNPAVAVKERQILS